MQPKVSVVIVNFNGKKFLDDCLGSLFNIHYPSKRLELILVDNGSEDGSVEYVRKNYPKTIVLESGENNYCAANNLGIQRAKGEYICFLNNDTRVTEDWLYELVLFIQTDEKIGAVGSKILFMDGTIQSVGHQEYPNYYWGDKGFREKDRGQYETPREVPSLSGCSVLYRRACLDDIGPFDEDFRFLLEDVDMAKRSYQKGWKFFFVPKSVLYHHYHGTLTDNKTFFSVQEEFLIERNRLILIAKHWPKELAKALPGISKYSGKVGPKAGKDIASTISDMFKKLISYHSPRLISTVLPELVDELRKYFNYEYGILIQKLAEIQEENKKIARQKETELRSIKEKFEKELRINEENFKEELRINEEELEKKLRIIQEENKKIALQKETEFRIIEEKLKEQYLRLFQTEDLVRKKDEEIRIKNRDLMDKERVIANTAELVKKKEDELHKALHMAEENEVNLQTCKNLLKDEKSRNNALEMTLREKNEELRYLHEKVEEREETIRAKAVISKEKDDAIKGFFRLKKSKFTLQTTQKALDCSLTNLKNSLTKITSHGSVSTKLHVPQRRSKMRSSPREKTEQHASSEWIESYFSHLQNNTLPPTPRRLTLMLTSKCNIDCRFCDVPDRQYDKKQLTKQEVTKILDDAMRLGIEQFDITGGEPLLHKDFFEIVSYAASLGLRVNLSTNGILLKKYMNPLLEAGLNCITVSIDGFKETHLKLRNMTTHYDDIMWALENLHACGQTVAVSFLVTNENINELEDLYELFKQKGILLLFFPVINKPDFYIMSRQDRDKFRNLVKRLKGEGAITQEQYEYHMAIFSYYDGQRSNVRCLGLCQEFGVDVNGDLFPCCVWSNPERPVPHLGNVLEKDLEELWYSEKGHNARVNIFKYGCGGCFNPDIWTFLQTGKSFLVKSNSYGTQNIKKREQKGKQTDPQEKKHAKPTSVHMRLTSRCNMSCRHCDIWKEKRTGKELSSGEWEQIIDRLYRWLGPFWLELAGGEMFLRKDLPNTIRYAYKKGIESNITSNAMLIDREVARRIIDAGLRALTVSLDGVKPQTHNYIRNNDKAFETVMQNVHYVNEQRNKKGSPFDINIATVINENNMDELEDIVLLTVNNVFSSITFQALDNNFNAPYRHHWFETNAFWPKDGEKVERVIDRLIEMKQEGYVINNSIDQLTKIKEYFLNPDDIGEHHCNTGDKNFIVNEFGKVLLCWNMESVGDILIDDPDEIWNNKLAETQRERIRKCDWTCRMLNCNFNG